MIQIQPFATKELSDGKKLYRRKYGYQHNLIAGTSTFEVTVPYARQKVNELSIFHTPEGVTASLKILDTASGTYSTIPNYILDQFGFDVNISKDSFEDISSYDAELFAGMRIQITFNNVSVIEKNIGINIVYHEVR